MTAVRTIPLLLCLAAAACAGNPKPPPECPEADGPVRQLNPGRWTPLPGDLDPAGKGAAR